MELQDDKRLTLVIEELIYRILNREKVLLSDWRLGSVDSVISSTSLKVFVDGSDTSQTIPCNPDVTFAGGDEVFVYRSRDGKIKFVPYKRGV